MIAVRQLTDAVCEHGEGPVWSERWAGPRFVDMLCGDVLELAHDGSVARRNVGSVAALVRARRGGGWLVVTQHAVALADVDALEAPLTPGPQLWSDPDVRANEGGCDPAGALHMGSMAWDASPGKGSLVRLDPAGTRTVELDAVTISNGLGWTADGTRAFYVDSPTGVIDVFDGPLTAVSRRGDRSPTCQVEVLMGLPSTPTVGCGLRSSGQASCTTTTPKGASRMSSSCRCGSRQRWRSRVRDSIG